MYVPHLSTHVQLKLCHICPQLQAWLQNVKNQEQNENEFREADLCPVSPSYSIRSEPNKSSNQLQVEPSCCWGWETHSKGQGGVRWVGWVNVQCWEMGRWEYRKGIQGMERIRLGCWCWDRVMLGQGLRKYHVQRFHARRLRRTEAASWTTCLSKCWWVIYCTLCLQNKYAHKHIWTFSAFIHKQSNITLCIGLFSQQLRRLPGHTLIDYSSTNTAAPHS